MESRQIGYQFLSLLEDFRGLLRIVGLGHNVYDIEGLLELLEHVPLGRLVGVELKAEGIESDLLKPALHHVNTVVETYESIRQNDEQTQATVSAGEFVLNPSGEETETPSSDILVIGNDIKGLNYRMAKCCNPIYGDDVFGFISAEGVIKVHRTDCPNARNIREKYPYRLIKTKWSGKFDGQMGVTLKILGNDDIGIVTNITSIITKEKNAGLRNISIDSHDGLFQGYLVVGVKDTTALNSLIKKIKTIKGVKDVQRAN